MNQKSNSMVASVNRLIKMGGKIVKMTGNSVTILMPEGGSREILKNPGLRNRIKNIEMAYYDEKGRFHPIRASIDYDPARAEEPYYDEEDIEVPKVTDRVPIPPRMILARRRAKARKAAASKGVATKKTVKKSAKKKTTKKGR